MKIHTFKHRHTYKHILHFNDEPQPLQQSSESADAPMDSIDQTTNEIINDLEKKGPNSLRREEVQEAEKIIDELKGIGDEVMSIGQNAKSNAIAEGKKWANPKGDKQINAMKKPTSVPNYDAVESRLKDFLPELKGEYLKQLPWDPTKVPRLTITPDSLRKSIKTTDAISMATLEEWEAQNAKEIANLESNFDANWELQHADATTTTIETIEKDGKIDKVTKIEIAEVSKGDINQSWQSRRYRARQALYYLDSVIPGPEQATTPSEKQMHQQLVALRDSIQSSFTMSSQVLRRVQRETTIARQARKDLRAVRNVLEEKGEDLSEEDAQALTLSGTEVWDRLQQKYPEEYGRYITPEGKKGNMRIRTDPNHNFNIGKAPTEKFTFQDFRTAKESEDIMAMRYSQNYAALKATSKALEAEDSGDFASLIQKVETLNSNATALIENMDNQAKQYNDQLRSVDLESLAMGQKNSNNGQLVEQWAPDPQDVMAIDHRKNTQKLIENSGDILVQKYNRYSSAVFDDVSALYDALPREFSKQSSSTSGLQNLTTLVSAYTKLDEHSKNLDAMERVIAKASTKQDIADVKKAVADAKNVAKDDILSYETDKQLDEAREQLASKTKEYQQNILSPSTLSNATITEISALKTQTGDVLTFFTEAANGPMLPSYRTKVTQFRKQYEDFVDNVYLKAKDASVAIAKDSDPEAIKNMNPLELARATNRIDIESKLPAGKRASKTIQEAYASRTKEIQKESGILGNKFEKYEGATDQMNDDMQSLGLPYKVLPLVDGRIAIEPDESGKPDMKAILEEEGIQIAQEDGALIFTPNSSWETVVQEYIKELKELTKAEVVLSNSLKRDKVDNAIDVDIEDIDTVKVTITDEIEIKKTMRDKTKTSMTAEQANDLLAALTEEILNA